MKPLKDMFLIKPSNDGLDLPIVGLNGEKLSIHKSYASLEYSPQYGEIYAVPIELSESAGDCLSLKKGDKIFFSYLICETINKIEYNDEEVYFCHYSQIFAKYENGELKPLNSVFFGKKIIDDNLYASN